MNQPSAIQKLRDVLRRKHLSLATERAYLQWLTRFIEFLVPLPDDLTSEQKIEAFLTCLAKQHVSASTQNQAFNALLFFYRDCLGRDLQGINALRARRPSFIRTAPDVQEVKALLGALQDCGGYPTRLLVRMIYGMGLRVSEPLGLRVKDFLVMDKRLILRGAKGGKDRVVPLPYSIFGELRAQLAVARGVWERDVLDRVPVKLPGLLDSKYPAWRFSWKWAWIFPSKVTCLDPRSGQTVRWHCHPVNIQRCVKEAARPLGLGITPHNLRHAYATHCLNRGVNIKALQAAMGHSNIETTMGYCHAEPCSVPSPLDELAVV